MKITKTTWRSLVIAAGALALAGCYVDSGRTLASDAEGFQQYSNATIGVSLLTPEGWSSEVTIGGEYVVTEPGVDGGQIMVFSASLERLMGEGVSGSTTLETFKDFRLSEITEKDIGPQLERSVRKSALGKNDAYEIQYSYKPEGEDRRRFVREIFTLVDGKVYRIELYNQVETDPEAQTAFEAMLDSFRILHQQTESN